MYPPIFTDQNLNNELYLGNFGRGFYPVNNVPCDKFKKWILEKYPQTTHIRLGPTCGLNDKMEWWIGGWTNPTHINNKPIWDDKIYSNYQKI